MQKKYKIIAYEPSTNEVTFILSCGSKKLQQNILLDGFNNRHQLEQEIMTHLHKLEDDMEQPSTMPNFIEQLMDQEIVLEE